MRRHKSWKRQEIKVPRKGKCWKQWPMCGNSLLISAKLICISSLQWVLLDKLSKIDSVSFPRLSIVALLTGFRYKSLCQRADLHQLKVGNLPQSQNHFMWIWTKISYCTDKHWVNGLILMWSLNSLPISWFPLFNCRDTDLALHCPIRRCWGKAKTFFTSGINLVASNLLRWWRLQI